MKFSHLLIVSAFVFSFLQGNAQSEKILKTMDNLENGRKTLEKLKGWLPKKKEKSDTVKTAASTAVTDKQGPNPTVTIIHITGIDFGKLKTFTENIKACAGVQTATFKFNADSSYISVEHTGSTESLLKLMELTSKDIFTDKNIQSFEEGKIDLKLS